LIEAERLVEALADLRHERAIGGLLDRALREHDRHEHRNERGEHDRERETPADPAGSGHGRSLATFQAFPRDKPDQRRAA
jgi:hypothetical protein